jgi:hypothetical protein
MVHYLERELEGCGRWMNEKKCKDETGMLLLGQNLWVGSQQNRADLEVLHKQKHTCFVFALLFIYPSPQVPPLLPWITITHQTSISISGDGMSSRQEFCKKVAQVREQMIQGAGQT